jgi:hypothetical protein
MGFSFDVEMEGDLQRQGWEMSGGVSVSMAQADSIGSRLESFMVKVARDPEGRDDVSGIVEMVREREGEPPVSAVAELLMKPLRRSWPLNLRRSGPDNAGTPCCSDWWRTRALQMGPEVFRPKVA